MQPAMPWEAVLDPEPKLVALHADDAGEVLTLQRAAYVTEARLYRDIDLPLVHLTKHLPPC